MWRPASYPPAPESALAMNAAPGSTCEILTHETRAAVTRWRRIVSDESRRRCWSTGCSRTGDASRHCRDSPWVVLRDEPASQRKTGVQRSSCKCWLRRDRVTHGSRGAERFPVQVFRDAISWNRARMQALILDNTRDAIGVTRRTQGSTTRAPRLPGAHARTRIHQRVAQQSAGWR